MLMKCNIVFKTSVDQVSLLNSLMGRSYDNQFLMGVIEKQKNGNFKVVVGPRYCREVITHHIHSRLSKSKVMQRKPLYLIIYENKQLRRHNFHKNLDKVLVILNSLEKEAGWLLTKKMELLINGTPIEDVELEPQYGHPHCLPATCVASIRCDHRWLKAPFMLSLLLLILRSSTTPIIQNTKIQNEKDVLIFLDKLSSKRTLKNDEAYLKKSVKYWQALTKYYNKVFKGITKKHLWASQKGKIRYIGTENWSLSQGHGYINTKTKLTHERAKAIADKAFVKMEVEGQ